MTRLNAPHFSDYSEYIGIPYREPDCEPGAPGLNCWELCEKIMIEVFGVEPPKYSYSVNGRAIAPVFVNELKGWKQVKRDERVAGDLVLLQIAGYPVHLGILISRTNMIHTLRHTGSACEQINSTKWRRRVIGFYRWCPA